MLSALRHASATISGHHQAVLIESHSTFSVMLIGSLVKMAYMYSSWCWRRRLPDVEGNCKYSYTESAVADSRQGVILRFRTRDRVLKLKLPRWHTETGMLSCRTVQPPTLISDFTVSESSGRGIVFGDWVFGTWVPRERFFIISPFRFPFVCDITDFGC
jgi:hypothetical protein